MSIGAYREILQRARQELSASERKRLAEELTVQPALASQAKADSRSLFDALHENNLIGFMHDGPGDLSTNPSYMEGFGQHAE